MTLRIVEGFDWMPTGLSESERKRLWGAKHYFFLASFLEEVPNVSTETRFSYGKAWQSFVGNITNTTSGESHTIPIGDLQTSGYAGIACWRGSGAQDSWSYIGFMDGVNIQQQFCVCIDQFGVLRVRRGEANGTVIGTSELDSFQYDQWFFLEVFGNLHNVNGEVEVRVNTKTVLSLVNVDNIGGTITSTFDSIRIGWYLPQANEVINFRFDDLYFCDPIGLINNTFLGNVRVKTQYVTGNSTPLDMTIGGSAPAATNWQSVLNVNLDSTKFVYSDTPGDQDLYTIEAILNAPLVHGVQISSAWRMDDATQRIGHNTIKSGASTAEGENHYVNQTFTFYKDIFETNPATGVKFTGVEANALLIGPKVNA